MLKVQVVHYRDFQEGDRVTFVFGVMGLFYGKRQQYNLETLGSDSEPCPLSKDGEVIALIEGLKTPSLME